MILQTCRAETGLHARYFRPVILQRGSWYSQRRGSVAPPVMIGSSRKCAGNHPLSSLIIGEKIESDGPF